MNRYEKSLNENRILNDIRTRSQSVCATIVKPKRPITHSGGLEQVFLGHLMIVGQGQLFYWISRFVSMPRVLLPSCVEH